MAVYLVYLWILLNLEKVSPVFTTKMKLVDAKPLIEKN